MPAKPEQVDIQGKAQASQEWPYGPIMVAPVTLLEEKNMGGWAPRYTPVGGKVKPNRDNPGTRGAADYYEANETEND